jgi:predicted lactoylglutathione lyase
LKETVRLTDICPVFPVKDIITTTEYNVNVSGFRYTKRYNKKDTFATIYHDSIKIVLVEKTIIIN